MIKRGFSLVEILIGIIILVISTLPLWGLMGSTHQQVIKSSDELNISQLTVEILEQLEYYYSPIDFPGDGFEKKDISLNVGEEITLVDGKRKLKIGHFDTYLEPKLSINIPSLSNAEKKIGCIVSLVMKYKNKEKHNQEYVLRGFISGCNK